MTYDVFLSHSSKDKAVTDAVCHYLESQGIRCWVAPRDVRLGESYATEIVRAITACRAVTLVFSDNANQSKAVQNELECAFSHGIPILPLRIEDVPFGQSLEFYLGATHWLDAFPPDENHFALLATALKRHLGQGGEQAEPKARPANSAARSGSGTGRSEAHSPAPRGTYSPAAVLSGLMLAIVLLGAGGYWMLKGTQPTETKPVPTRTPEVTRAAETRSARAEPTRAVSHRKTPAATTIAAVTAKPTASAIESPSPPPAETRTPKPTATPQDTDKKQDEQTATKQTPTPTPEPVLTRIPVHTPVHTQTPSPQPVTPATGKLIRPIRRSGGTSISAEAAGALTRQRAVPELQRR